MPLFVSFQVLVMIQNLVIHQCIIDEGESTCVMSTFVWQKLGSPTVQPSTTTLRTYDGHSSQPHDILTNVPVDLADKIMLIGIEVFNVQLDYNLILGRSYMYAM